MRRIRVGGWTRVWVCVSAVFLVAAISDWRSDSRYSREKAEAQYKSDLQTSTAYVQGCDERREKGKPASSFEQWLGVDDCKNADLVALKREAQQKLTAAIAAGDDAALSSALNLFLWPSACLAALFAALGWIKAGFKRRVA